MKRKAAAGHFEDACREAHLNYSVHHDCNIAIQDLLHESIYADLIIIDGHETFGHDEAPIPTQFICDLLTGVQCPVLVVPGVYRDIKRIMLLYDGELSSVHAIKMFSYLFPELQKLETEVLSVNSPEGGLHLEDGRLVLMRLRLRIVSSAGNSSYCLLRPSGRRISLIMGVNAKYTKITVLIYIGSLSRSLRHWVKNHILHHCIIFIIVGTEITTNDLPTN